ncbi:MAG: T9SS type A sorting domain-containing protein [Candidatus Cloacimonetes bacterium]|nr:T9SS type A sorting domain-containing protein [Candidatus Cloacimonadota bacterium]
MKSLFVVILTVLISNIFATIINIPDDQPTIQEGIDISVNGDTVMVQPNIYFENINYNGKNITVASYFLTTQDTSYIDQTIINGNYNGSIITFDHNENSLAKLIGFSLTEGSGKHFCIELEPEIFFDEYRGGAIYCNSSNPEISFNKIFNNSANLGGAIYCTNSNSVIKNSKIFDNQTLSGEWTSEGGGGLYCFSSNLEIENIEFYNNSTSGSGGGLFAFHYSNLSIENLVAYNNSAVSGGALYFTGSNSEINNSHIFNNFTSNRGGGIVFRNECNINLNNVNIQNNNSEEKGGGIFCAWDSDLYLTNTTISNNSAQQEGGGIYCTSATINFDSIDKCNIYSNYSLWGNDFYSNSFLNVIVDTFTVIEPTEYYAFPIDNFNFDVENAILAQIVSDVYVSPNGNDSNSGTSWAEALKTINNALFRIQANSNNPRTIFLDSGIYSSSTNGEIFPIYPISYLTIQGMGETETEINANGLDNVLFLNQTNNIIIRDVKISNGLSGIYSRLSSLEIENVYIINNNCEKGAGIYSKDSSIICDSITLAHNIADDGGGMYLMRSDISITNSIITANHALVESGGGLHFYDSNFIVENTRIINNYSKSDGGGLYFQKSTGDLLNTEIMYNQSQRGGGLSNRWESDINLMNVSILYNKAYCGGGIYQSDVSNMSPTFIEFQQVNRCNIYLNQAPYANDFYIRASANQEIDVFVDTFTVVNPSSFHYKYSGYNDFSLDIFHGKIEQINSDLYVSPEGNDQNIGDNQEYPLKTIYLASAKIIANESNQKTINLLSGIYSPITNQENFPISCADFVTYKGQSTFETILDANDENSVVALNYFEQLNFKDMKMINGSKSGIYSYYSNINLKRVEISNNRNFNYGAGGINSAYSNINICNSSIIQNYSISGAGAISCTGSEMNIINSLLWDNEEQQIYISNPYGSTASMIIAYSDIQFGESSISITEECELDYEESNIDLNPLFVNPSEMMYYLQENSPCVDSGTNFYQIGNEILVDLDSNEYYGSAPDIGAYEYGFVNVDELSIIPLNKCILFQNYPNPFNPETKIDFSLNEKKFIELNIYNAKGQKVKTLANKQYSKGNYSVIWNGNDDSCKKVSSAVYFYRLKVDGKIEEVKKCLLLK